MRVHKDKNIYDSYFGGKGGAGTYQTIINQIPKHKKYIELFLGSGQIIRHKRLAEINIGVELSLATIDKYNFTAERSIIVKNDCAISYAAGIIDNSNYALRKTDPTDIFIYADPPYPISSRKSKRNVYEYEMTDKQHIQLLKILLSMPAGINIAISTYPNKLYSSMLPEWRYIDFQSQTRQGLATERLYMNYPQPKELHDYQYLGTDFTDRQRIKRKINRWVKKLSGLNTLEQKAIMNRLTI